MPAFAVKHIEKNQGPLSSIMSEIKKTPYSYTSKYREASIASKGNFIYVIEVRAEKSGRSYWLGYKYKAFESFQCAGGALWKGEFKYKNSARPMSTAEGQYFNVPVRLFDVNLCVWLSSKQPGMAEIPSYLISALEGVLNDPANGAQPFA
ncbi:MAG: hypothetical protein JSR69_05645 [Proteobacteria bacterium]|nr:hypothetical protein [Pseudomonadota bacterium]